MININTTWLTVFGALLASGYANIKQASHELSHLSGDELDYYDLYQ